MAKKTAKDRRIEWEKSDSEARGKFLAMLEKCNTKAEGRKLVAKMPGVDQPGRLSYTSLHTFVEHIIIPGDMNFNERIAYREFFDRLVIAKELTAEKRDELLKDLRKKFGDTF